MLRKICGALALLGLAATGALGDERVLPPSAVTASFSVKAPAPAPAPVPVKARTRFTRREIKKVQEHLIATGWYRGPITGRLTKASVQALRDWQKANHLPVTGTLSESVLAYCD